jgi:hypothetical protein
VWYEVAAVCVLVAAAWWFKDLYMPKMFTQGRNEFNSTHDGKGSYEQVKQLEEGAGKKDTEMRKVTSTINAMLGLPGDMARLTGGGDPAKRSLPFDEVTTSRGKRVKAAAISLERALEMPKEGCCFAK